MARANPEKVYPFRLCPGRIFLEENPIKPPFPLDIATLDSLQG